MTKRPRIKERKLLREGVVGLCWIGEGLIEIDPRLQGFDRLDTLLHEMLHHYCPHWSEQKVLKTANDMAKILWKDRYRRIDSTAKPGNV
jgi:hypothetical protein